MADTSYRWTSFLKKCWEFMIYVINFFRGKKQNQVDKVNEDLRHDYNKIDQDKENKKQDEIKDRLNDMFK